MLRRSLAFVIALVVLAGCGETSLIGRRVDNFTAYYNTFYNARKSFDAGVTSLQAADQPISRDEFLRVYPAPDRAGNRRDFDDAIRRSADVLREHPNSRWIDDAVMLIGQSYFYQQNFSAAAQKFQEAVALDTRLQDEARFWLARTLVVNGETDRARDHLSEALERDAIDRRVLPRLHLVRADLAVRTRDWAGAIEALQLGLRDVRESGDAARGWFLLGQVYEHVGEAAEAQAAYERVTRLSAPFELDYAARLHATRLNSALGNRAAAVDGLRRLERDAKYSDRRAEIAYYRGLAHQDVGEIDLARDVFDEILYSGAYDVSRVRGRVHYAMAALYRDAYGDFLSAAAHFDTAATAIQAPQRGQAVVQPGVPTRLAILDSREQADVYRTYARVYSDVARMDSLLHLASLSDDEFDAFVLDLRQRLARELEERRRAEQRQRLEQQFVQPDGGVQSPGVSGETGAQAGAAAGFLFHRDPIRVQEGRQAFNRRWGERPLVPGWRRADAVAAFQQRRSAEDEPETIARLRDVSPRGDEGLPYIDVSDVPRDPFLFEQMRLERARASYELGNVLFLSMRRPDLAVDWYRSVIDDELASDVRGRAYYALAEVMRDDGDLDQARRLYQEVLQMTDDADLLRRVRENLGLEVTARTDSASIAATRYDEAFRLWQRDALPAAYEAMIETAMLFPTVDAAPRALMAAAEIGLQWLRRDSLSFFDPVPVAFPDTLLVAGGLLDATALQPIASIGFMPDDPTRHIGQALTITRILSHLASRYSTHGLADRGRHMLAGLQEMRPAPEVDEALLPDEDEAMNIPEPDVQPADDDILVESVTLPSITAPTEAARVTALPNALRGDGTLDVEAGGWTVHVGEFSARALAEQRASDLRRDGFLAGVLERPGEDRPTFAVVVGQFADEAAAEVALFEEPDALGDGALVIRLGTSTDSQ